MKTFSIRTLLILMTMAAVCVYLFSGGYRTVFDETLENYGRVEVKAKNDAESGELLLRVIFTPELGKDQQIVSEIMKAGQTKMSDMKFGSLVDQQTGLWTIFDSGETYFIFLAYPANQSKDRGFWHNGIHIGWARGVWARRYSEMKKRHPELPFENMPGEMHLIYEKK